MSVCINHHTPITAVFRINGNLDVDQPYEKQQQQYQQYQQQQYQQQQHYQQQQQQYQQQQYQQYQHPLTTINTISTQYQPTLSSLDRDVMKRFENNSRKVNNNMKNKNKLAIEIEDCNKRIQLGLANLNSADVDRECKNLDMLKLKQKMLNINLSQKNIFERTSFSSFNNMTRPSKISV
jgi:hypothetical protein